MAVKGLIYMVKRITACSEYVSDLLFVIVRVHPVAVTGSPNLLCCILRYFSDFAFCFCVI